LTSLVIIYIFCIKHIHKKRLDAKSTDTFCDSLNTQAFRSHHKMKTWLPNISYLALAYPGVSYLKLSDPDRP